VRRKHGRRASAALAGLVCVLSMTVLVGPAALAQSRDNCPQQSAITEGDTCAQRWYQTDSQGRTNAFVRVYDRLGQAHPHMLSGVRNTALGDGSAAWAINVCDGTDSCTAMTGYRSWRWEDLVWNGFGIDGRPEWKHGNMELGTNVYGTFSGDDL